MLKILRLIFPLFLLACAHLFSMEEQDAFAQEHDFHHRLQTHDPNLMSEGAQAYYKRIDAITSRPNVGIDRWEVANVSIANQRVSASSDGTYTHGDVSITIDPSLSIDPNSVLNILVNHRGENKTINFIKLSERKIPLFPSFNSYSAILNAIGNNQISFIEYVTLGGILQIPGENRRNILIELRNRQAKPITLKGMEIAYFKDERATKIFFDFVDDLDQPIDYFNAIKFNHSSIVITPGQNILHIKNHKAYECSNKEIWGYFDSPEIRRAWVLDESNFYDQSLQRVTCLPSCYCNSNDQQEVIKENIVWVFENADSFYALEREVLKDSSDYIYSDNNLFFLSLLYKGNYKECFSNGNIIEVEHLIKVDKPHLTIESNVSIEGGVNEWLSGVYKREHVGDRSIWRSIENSEEEINFNNKLIRLDIISPIEPLSILENNQWCRAAQQFLVIFSTRIRICDRNLSEGLKVWNKLQYLDLSNLKLDKSINWSEMFTAVGTMIQLKSLSFENNHPVSDFFKTWTYESLANTASDYYLEIAVCLGKLVNLEELHVKGLWLKPCKELGRGCRFVHCVSTEVAILTGIINHKNQVGIRSIINSICLLKSLKELSIDSIPNYGSSSYSRKTDGQAFVLLPIFIIAIPFNYNDGSSQNESLQKLVIDAANSLAHIPSLRNISIYSPGGNCIDYFSKEFTSRLIQARKSSQLPNLSIASEVLQ